MKLLLPKRFSFGRDVHLVVLSLVLANIGTRVEERFFQLYVRDLGGSPANIGLLATVAGLVIVVLSPLGGWLTDRYRRVTLFAIAPLLGATGCILMYLAPTWEWLVPGFVLSMMPGLLVGPALFGLMSDLGPGEQRGSRFAYEAAAFGVCATVGPLAGGLIYQYFGYKTFLLAQALMLCLAAALRSLVRDPRDAARARSGYRHPGLWSGLKTAAGFMARSRELRLFFAVACLWGFGAAATLNLTSVFMSEVIGVSEAAMGSIYAVAGAAGIVASLAGGVASDRFGRRPVIALSAAGFGLSLVCLTGAGSLAGLSAVWLLSGFMMELGGPAVDALLADLTEENTRGTVHSVFNSLESLAMLPGPLLGGLLWEWVSPSAPFWFGGLVAVLSGVIVLLYFKEARPARRPGERPVKAAP